MVGVAGAEPGPEGIGRQAEFVRSCCVPFAEDLRRGGIHERACERNGEGGYGPVEAEFLHCFIRARRPRRVVQVGCGVSTAVILGAAEAGGDAPEIVCVEPTPARSWSGSTGGADPSIASRPKGAMDVLRGRDRRPVFIDSTHTARLGSSARLILRFAAGAGVAVTSTTSISVRLHARVLTGSILLAGSVMLHAMLAMNPGYRIDASLDAAPRRS